MDVSSIETTEIPDIELLTASEAAALLKVSAKTVYVMMQSGEISTVRWGKTVRIRKQDLKEFIVAHLNGSQR
jgi:excisionase family DNA binding protein